jgi:hypothetical protein
MKASFEKLLDFAATPTGLVLIYFGGFILIMVGVIWFWVKNPRTGLTIDWKKHDAAEKARKMEQNVLDEARRRERERDYR